MSDKTQTTNPVPAIGDLIRIHRERHRYGVRGLAKIIGVSPATLNRIECGGTMDARAQLKIICWMFGHAQ